MSQLDLFGNKIHHHTSIADEFLMCPTSILNKRDSKWSKLKRKWIKLGIQSELGRNTISVNYGNGRSVKDYDYMSGSGFKAVGMSHATSVFDPVICEIIYKWFCPSKGNILDPFAGGSVRGIVSNYLNYNYTGIELRQEQVDSNRQQGLKILDVNNQPNWYVGDSDKVLDNFNKEFDLVFSCPPYMGLEKYSDMNDDLSNMNDNDFYHKYKSIINKSCRLLKQGGYAVFVVGDLRDKDGYQKDFTGETKRIFIECGMKLYNELILIEPIGTKAMTMKKTFKNGKLAKVHQNIYIFKKP